MPQKAELTITVTLEQDGVTKTASSKAYAIGRKGLPESIASQLGVEHLVSTATTAIAAECFQAIQKRDRKK